MHRAHRVDTITSAALISLSDQACLNAPEPAGNENGVDAPEVPAESPEDVNHNNVNPPQSNMPRPGGMHPGYMTNEQQMAYYQNLQQQQQQAGGQYAGMPVQRGMPPQHQPTA
jgi:pheromone receptor transcription factor